MVSVSDVHMPDACMSSCVCVNHISLTVIIVYSMGT